MSFIEENLSPDEDMVHKGVVSWLIYLPAFFWIFIAAVIFYIGRFELGIFSPALNIIVGFVILISLMKFSDAMLYQACTDIGITTKRLVAKFGFVAIKTFELPLGSIESVNISQSVIERISGCGTVTVHGTGMGIAPIRFLSNPVRFRNELNEAITALKNS
jgi:membrane protein YdbS with pleckstrin-like domain